MSARATRGPILCSEENCRSVSVALPAAVGERLEVFRTLGAPSRTSQRRSNSSETETPKESRDSTKIRTEVPALRSFMSIALYGSNMSDFLVFLLFASAIKAASFWASPGLLIGIVLGQVGHSLGKAKGKAGELLGENLSAERLDDGVSLKQLGDLC